MNLQAYYSAWFDTLPDGRRCSATIRMDDIHLDCRRRLRDTPPAVALQAIIDLDLHELAAIMPPRGYGRD